MLRTGAAIAVAGVSKRYGGRAVVDDLSFQVGSGEVFALLGPNGAGKTTTLEMLEGYRAPDSGRVRVLGLDPIAQGAALKPRLGLMLQQGGIYPHIRCLEALRLFAAFYAHPEDPPALLERVGLADAAGTRYRRLSGGQKQRLALALALVGRPELVFLDEPTAGMDPQARHATWGLIQGLQQRGVTVFLTTHFMDEAQRLADRVAIIDRGRLVALGPPAELVKDGAAGAGLRFRAPAGLDTAALSLFLELSAAPAARPTPPTNTTPLGSRNRGRGGFTPTEKETSSHGWWRPTGTWNAPSEALGRTPAVRELAPGYYAVAAVPTPLLLARLTGWLSERDVLLTELRIGGNSLEEVYLRLTGDSGEFGPA